MILGSKCQQCNFENNELLIYGFSYSRIIIKVALKDGISWLLLKTSGARWEVNKKVDYGGKKRPVGGWEIEKSF